MRKTSKLDKSLFRRFSIRPNWVRPRKISVLYSLCFSVRAQSRAKSWIFNSIWVLLDVSCGSLLILVGWVLSKTSSWSSSSISSSFSSLYFSRFLITVIYSASSDDFVRSFQLNEAIIWKKIPWTKESSLSLIRCSVSWSWKEFIFSISGLSGNVPLIKVYLFS